VTVETAFLLFGFHRLAHEFRKPGKLGFAVERQRVGLLVGEQVLAERGAELSQALDDLGETLLRRAIEGDASAATGYVIALEHALLFGGKIESVPPPCERIDAAEQCRVGADSVPVAGDLRGNLALDFKDCIVTVGAGEKMEDAFNARQGPAAQFERVDGIGKIRRLGPGADGLDLGLMFRDCAGIGRSEVLGLDARERRNSIGGRPMLEKRIVGGR